MESLNEVIARYETGKTFDGADEVIEVEVRRPLEKIMPVRLTDEQWRALQQEARRIGFGPSTLARMWIIERLAIGQATPAEQARQPDAPAEPPRRAFTEAEIREALDKDVAERWQAKQRRSSS